MFCTIDEIMVASRIFFVWMLLSSGGLYAQSTPEYITFPADIDWVTRTSPHFQIHYRKGEDAFAIRTLLHAERAHEVLSPIFPPGPEKTFIVLADFHDATNGYALNFPFPHMVIFASPPEASGQLSSLDDWLYTLVLHEYVHILHIYPAKGLWKIARSIFGTVVLPNGLMPTHLHEGLATFLETQFSTGGRGRGTHFRMYRRMAVQNNTWNLQSRPMDRMESSHTLWPHGTAPYFYGYYLYEELWKMKNREGLYALTDSASSNWPFFHNTPLNEVYGIRYEDLWNRIYSTGTEEIRQEIQAILSGTLPPLEYLTDSRYSKGNLALSPDALQIAFRSSSPNEGMKIQILDTSTSQIVDSIDLKIGATSGLCWSGEDAHSQLFFPENESHDYYSLNLLAGYDFKTRSTFRVVDGSGNPFQHVILVTCHPKHRSILIYQESAGESWVRELEWKRREDGVFEGVLKKEWRLPEGTWISGMSAADRTWLALRRGSQTELLSWNTAVPEPVRVLPGHVYGLQPQRGILLAIGGFDGRDEIWEIPEKNREVFKRVGLLGGTNAFVVSNEKIYLSSYRDGGYDIAHTRWNGRKGTLLKSPAPEVPSKTQPSISEEQPYRAWETLIPRTWAPNLLFVPDGLQIGIWIPGFDVVQRHYYDVIGGYDSRGLLFADLRYNYRFSNHVKLGLDAYHLPSYLISQKTFLKRWGLGVATTLHIPGWEPTFTVRALFRRLERSMLDGSKQNIGVGLDTHYNLGIKKHPLAPYPHLGTRLSLSHNHYFQTLGSSDNFFSSIASVSQFLPSPVAKTHSFSLTLKGAYTEGTSIVNSYFEAGGELLLSQGRGVFLNRGFQPGTFIGRRIVNANLEYRFLISHIERGHGMWPFFLKYLHGALVADSTTLDGGKSYDPSKVNPVEIFQVYYFSTGAELKSDWILAYYLPTQIRLGAYHGFGPSGEPIYISLGLEAHL